VLVAWFTRRPQWQRLEEAAVSAVVVTSLMMFWWQPEPRYYMSPTRLIALASRPAIERELDPSVGAPTSLAAGLAREQELTAGKLLVFDEHYSGYPSLFWNNTYSNRVRFMSGGPGFLARAAQAGATWIFLAPQDPQLAAARAPGSGWQEVGELNPIIPGFAFRRVAGAAPAAAAPAVRLGVPPPVAPKTIAPARPSPPRAVGPLRDGAPPRPTTAPADRTRVKKRPMSKSGARGPASAGDHR